MSLDELLLQCRRLVMEFDGAGYKTTNAYPLHITLQEDAWLKLASEAFGGGGLLMSPMKLNGITMTGPEVLFQGIVFSKGPK